MFGEARNGCLRIKYDLGSVQSENARALGKVPVIADINTDLSIACLKNGIASVAGGEIKLLPETGSYLGNMVLPILSQVRSIGVDDGRSIEVQTRHLLFIHRDHYHHFLLGGQLLHQ